MSDLRAAAQQFVTDYENGDLGDLKHYARALRAALEQPERTLTDEVIANLWHQNGGFHHHFARAVERYLKGEK
jgi:hypothetical protein